MKLMAIDPGLKGGLAIFDAAWPPVETRRMPLHKMQLQPVGQAALQVDVPSSQHVVEAYSIDTIVTEYQTAMPGQSSVGTATSFINWGLVLSLRALARLHVVHPRMWKKHYGLGKDKQAAIRHARNLLGLPLNDASSDGEAEAALIGKYWLSGEASENELP